MQILIVTSKFNQQITQALHRGCVDTLLASGEISAREIESLWVPGAFEIPVTVAQAVACATRNCVICLGAIIKGETQHFELLAQEVSRALMQLSIENKIPVIFEVLATYNREQAWARCGLTGDKNRGQEAAQAALSMVQMMSRLKR